MISISMHNHLCVLHIILIFRNESLDLQIMNILNYVDSYYQEFDLKKICRLYEIESNASFTFPVAKLLPVMLEVLNRPFVQWNNIWHQSMKIKELFQHIQHNMCVSFGFLVTILLTPPRSHFSCWVLLYYFLASFMYQRYFIVLDCFWQYQGQNTGLPTKLYSHPFFIFLRQVVAKLPDSPVRFELSVLPASAFQSAKIEAMCHHSQPTS